MAPAKTTAMKYTPVIGLEVHVELKTMSKMFCRCSADYFGKEPNTHTCPVCLGLPGALPVANAKAIEWCIMIALSLNCEINLLSKFDRKNYFYPDLAKGYQISQYDLPFGKNGSIELKSGKKIRIRRVHMEEDTAKLTHGQLGDQNSELSAKGGSAPSGKSQNNEKVSLIDFNRSGVPLVEIVTEPDFSEAGEVKEYLQKLQQIVRYLDVSNADMEKGDMRLEPNISLQVTRNTPHEGKNVSPVTSHELPSYKVEVKNINSFRFVEKAINFEVKRQEDILEKGQSPVQETRGWSEIKNQTVSQRLKEEANDYRYFPEPDIPPIRHTKEQISTLLSRMPELPDAKYSRFLREFSLNDYDTEILTREKSLADFFEEAVRVGKDHSVTPKQIANTLINKKVDPSSSEPASIVKQIVQSGQVTSIKEEELEKIVTDVLESNQKAVGDYKSGKETAIMFLVGQVMRQFTTKIDASVVKETIKRRLS
ncbi:MAG: Asp-tRNA(Asn)/Glu-tRNA(Gln) amidotransferase subunit GatB [bacterium]|nr:Asp-tRNA(Asn)/Glu-tRNA(Gln) amidotransferase subunit GatB [bacterium]